MYATLINAALILVGSLLGLLCKSFISTRFTSGLTHALGLCVLGIGVTSAIGTRNTLCVIICMVLGTLSGEGLRIEERLDGLGGLLQKKLFRGAGGGGRFSEGFMNASVLFCVGAMAITGSLEAGLTGDGTILISKGVIDGVTAITFASAMGVGVAFSAVPLVLYQGGLTLLATVVGPYLDPAVVTEISAVGGVIIMGIAINMLGLGQGKIKVGNIAAGHIFAGVVHSGCSMDFGAFIARLIFCKQKYSYGVFFRFYLRNPRERLIIKSVKHSLLFAHTLIRRQKKWDLSSWNSRAMWAS